MKPFFFLLFNFCPVLSIPSHDSLPDKTVKGLKTGMSRQISPAQGIIIIGGMYAAHSDWINYEIDEAVRMKKRIIGIKPRGQQRTHLKLQLEASVNGRMVNWNRASIIQAVRDLI